MSENWYITNCKSPMVTQPGHPLWVEGRNAVNSGSRLETCMGKLLQYFRRYLQEKLQKWEGFLEINRGKKTRMVENPWEQLLILQ